MALTLPQAANLSNDVLLQGVVETMIQESPILRRLPFETLNGNALRWNEEDGLADVDFHAVGDTWDEDTPNFIPRSTALAIMGGDADVDRYLASTRSNVNDLDATIITLKAKATAYKFDQHFIIGDSGDDPNEFDGLDTLIPGSHTMSLGDDGGPLTLEAMDEFIDMTRGRPPDMIIMSRRSRRQLNALSRGTDSGVLSTQRNEFGQFVQLYNDIEIAVNDWITDNNTVGMASNASSIYSVRFGEGEVYGIQGAGGLQVEPIGPLETKDAHRYRVKWYCAVIRQSPFAANRMAGVIPPSP